MTTSVLAYGSKVLLTEIETSVAIICDVAVLHNMARPNVDDIDVDYYEDTGGLDDIIIENPNSHAIQYFYNNPFSNN